MHWIFDIISTSASCGPWKRPIMQYIMYRQVILNRWDPLAHLAELVDALVLGTSDFGRGSSSLPVGIF